VRVDSLNDWSNFWGAGHTDIQFKAISKTFDGLKAAEEATVRELGLLERQAPVARSVEDDVAAALADLANLPTLAQDANDLPALGELIRRLDVQVYLKFQGKKKKKRIENEMVGGLLTWGDAEPPIQKYHGEVGRQLAGLDSPDGRIAPIDSGLEEKSLGNVSRGDRI
jgi:hypothetical protein